MAATPAKAVIAASKRCQKGIGRSAITSPSSAATLAGPHTAPGLSDNPGGRMISSPLGPTYFPIASSLKTDVISLGMKISGNFTCSTPTTAFSPLQINRIAMMR